MHGGQLPDTGDGGTNQGRLTTVPHTLKEECASFGCTDHEMVVFRILRGGNKAKSRIMPLDFRGMDFILFRDLLGRMTTLWSNAKCSMDVLLYLNLHSKFLFRYSFLCYARNLMQDHPLHIREILQLSSVITRDHL